MDLSNIKYLTLGLKSNCPKNLMPTMYIDGIDNILIRFGNNMAIFGGEKNSMWWVPLRPN